MYIKVWSSHQINFSQLYERTQLQSKLFKFHLKPYTHTKNNNSNGSFPPKILNEIEEKKYFPNSLDTKLGYIYGM